MKFLLLLISLVNGIPIDTDKEIINIHLGWYDRFEKLFKDLEPGKLYFKGALVNLNETPNRLDLNEKDILIYISDEEANSPTLKRVYCHKTDLFISPTRKLPPGCYNMTYCDIWKIISTPVITNHDTIPLDLYTLKKIHKIINPTDLSFRPTSLGSNVCFKDSKPYSCTMFCSKYRRTWLDEYLVDGFDDHYVMIYAPVYHDLLNLLKDKIS